MSTWSIQVKHSFFDKKQNICPNITTLTTKLANFPPPKM